jgi:hypothetical protein
MNAVNEAAVAAANEAIEAAAKKLNDAVFAAGLAAHEIGKLGSDSPEYAKALALSDTILLGLTNNQEGKISVNTFGQKVYVAAIGETMARLNAVGGKKKKPQKITAAELTTNHLLRVRPDVFTSECKRLLEEGLAAIETGLESKIDSLNGKHLRLGDKSTEAANVLADTIEKERDNAVNKAAALRKSARKANAWFKGCHKGIGYAIAIRRTLKPAPLTLGNYLYSPEGIAQFLLTGIQPDVKAVASKLHTAAATSAMDLIKADIKANRTNAGKMMHDFMHAARDVETTTLEAAFAGDNGH